MANGLVEKQSLQDIANAIRTQNNQTTKYKPADMDDAILGLTNTQDATAKNSDISKDKTAYGGGGILTGTLEDSNSSYPTVTLSKSDYTMYRYADYENFSNEDYEKYDIQNISVIEGRFVDLDGGHGNAILGLRYFPSASTDGDSSNTTLGQDGFILRPGTEVYVPFGMNQANYRIVCDGESWGSDAGLAIRDENGKYRVGDEGASIIISANQNTVDDSATDDIDYLSSFHVSIPSDIGRVKIIPPNAKEEYITSVSGEQIIEALINIGFYKEFGEIYDDNNIDNYFELDENNQYIPLDKYSKYLYVSHESGESGGTCMVMPLSKVLKKGFRIDSIVGEYEEDLSALEAVADSIIGVTA